MQDPAVPGLAKEINAENRQPGQYRVPVLTPARFFDFPGVNIKKQRTREELYTI